MLLLGLHVRRRQLGTASAWRMDARAASALAYTKHPHCQYDLAGKTIALSMTNAARKAGTYDLSHGPVAMLQHELPHELLESATLYCNDTTKLSSQSISL